MENYEKIDLTIDLTIELLKKYNEVSLQTSNPWNVRFSDYMYNLAECDHLQREIRFNSIILENNDFEIIKYLVYHEVAHVLNGRQVNKQVHGSKFRKINKELGGKSTFVRWNSKLKQMAI